ncbi:bifunctional serine/threonine-protein kinase/formylglycine-generating enzyme family protein [Thalassoglobus polymorphus]|uniref:Serine/threonine-protein kinase PknB n=1 Tax=Thalassoglobus polymorphus TaxID=2527994 RepID=A0A517QIE6_9PLAN|nr:bifunctional serine/threonine-protein kinase/formylglycine-generating enzyme family protein [Thalassoglobus polymorphus]QDT31337.1 Serine/threonine-protein kinase PknB [Thalassoglobus polymorphus]
MISLNQFASAVQDLGILSKHELDAMLLTIRQSAPRDALKTLARKLVRSEVLTTFQANQILSGKAKSLILGNCLILDQLGKGGMGTVYKARHIRMDRIVAVKVISPEFTKNSSLLARFQKEVKLAAKLDHPNVVAAYDAGEALGIHYLVMQFVEGKDLAAVLKQTGPVSVSFALQAVKQISAGLEYAHSRGVIHRDIKPANLLLDESGNVKILDMGLARFTRETMQGDAEELTQSGVMMGTAAYMAPEQSLNCKAADERSDIYSLGCVLYHLLTGKTMYRCETYLETAIAHREKPVPLLSSPFSEISEGLQQLYNKMVCKEPDERFQDMSSLRNELDDLLNSESMGEKKKIATDDLELQSFINELSIVNTPTRVWPLSATTHDNNNNRTMTSAPPVADDKKRPATSPPHSGTFRNLARKLLGIKAIGSIAGCLLLILISVFVLGGSRKGEPLFLVVQVADDQFLSSIRGQLLTLRNVDTNALQKIELTHSSLKFQNLKSGTYELSAKADSGLRVDPEKFSLQEGQTQKVKIWWEMPAIESTSTVWGSFPKDAPAPSRIPFSADEARTSQQKWATYLKIPVEFKNSAGIKMRLIPPGEFIQGISEGDANFYENEAARLSLEEFLGPEIQERVSAHRVCLTHAFYISATEITQQQFETVSGFNPSAFSATGAKRDQVQDMQTDSFPVDTTWYQAVEFCSKLNKLEGKKSPYLDFDLIPEIDGYRLPTEAEWEFACRAGTKDRWWWGNRAIDFIDQEWNGVNSGTQPHEVATAKPNQFGLYDMYGNYWEWCHDWSEPFKTQFWDECTTNPTGPTVGESRVTKGGSFHTSVQVGSSDYRGHSPPDRADGEIGFRIVLPVTIAP